MKRIYLSILLLLLFTTANIIAGDGGRTSVFSDGAGARSQAMGGAFVAIADNPSAAYYNPAALSFLNYQELTLMHRNLYEGTIYNFAAWVYPDVKLGGFGLSYYRIGTDDIIRKENYIETGRFNYAQYQLMLSYSKKLLNNFALGVNYKVIHQKIADLSDNSYALDLSIYNRFNNYLSAGFSIYDFVPSKLELGQTTETSTTSFRAGLGVNKYPVTQAYELTAAFDIVTSEDTDIKFHAGTEIVYDKSYALRAGYDRDNFTFGTGLKLNRMKLDYTYKVHDYLENTHTFALSFLIGTSSEEKLQREKQQEENRGTVLIEDERLRQFGFYRQKADDFYNQYRLDSALVYYQRALAFDENNEKVIGTIAVIERSITQKREAQAELERTRLEYETLIETYLSQAQSFYQKKYYLASLDMLELIHDIDSTHFEANNLKQTVNRALNDEIQSKLKTASNAEQTGNIQLALEAYSRVLELDSDNETVKRGAANDILHHVARFKELQELEERVSVLEKER